MSDSEDSDFSDNQSDRSSDGEAEEVEENEVTAITSSPPGVNTGVTRWWCFLCSDKCLTCLTTYLNMSEQR